MIQGSIIHNCGVQNNQSKSPRKGNDKAIVKSQIRSNEVVSEK